jgi:hypothetical protein
VYYPVSALVTLFANILQNPQDARARSDLKLMNSMTEFLQMLCNEDGNVHCRRMASICKEFERIARVVLDKAERDIKGRGKRKNRDSESAGPPVQPCASSTNIEGACLDVFEWTDINCIAIYAYEWANTTSTFPILTHGTHTIHSTIKPITLSTNHQHGARTLDANRSTRTE